MRLGFVGVGKHARRLAAEFSECVASVVAHDRKSDSDGILEGFGRRMPWRGQITSPDIDAIICCAPPEVGSQVVRMCVARNKRCVISKPLMWDWPSETWPDDLSMRGYKESIYVDLWRLYSPAWRALKAELGGRRICSVRIDFCGDGPVRQTHSGLLDYGPHALAFLLDLGLQPELTWRVSEEDKYRGQRKLWEAKGRVGDCMVQVETGNLGRPLMLVGVAVEGDLLRWQETPPSDGLQLHEFCVNAGKQLECQRDLALREFCRAFLAGEPSDTLRISCEAMRILRAAEAQTGG